MFKKIHSNRTPGVTVFGEVKKEFSIYFVKFEKWCQSLADRYPEFLFRLMILLMAVSLILSFTVFRNKDTSSEEKMVSVKKVPLNTGFDQIINTGTALKTTIRLKAEVDSLTAQKSLTLADSMQLEKDLDQLREISKQFSK
jgi:hypothetical protein